MTKSRFDNSNLVFETKFENPASQIHVSLDIGLLTAEVLELLFLISQQITKSYLFLLVACSKEQFSNILQ
jgi:hypothetical protein